MQNQSTPTTSRANRLIFTFALTQLFIQNANAFDCSTANTGVPAAECEALVELYEATEGDLWTQKTHWLEPERPVSDWHGIETYDGHVIRLNLSNNHLVGKLPAALNALSELRALILSSNQLTGVLPAIWNLQKLYLLSLSDNQLSGTLPAALGTLSQLRVLTLDRNQFKGKIPAALGNLNLLMTLSLNDNQLSGTIPSTLGFAPDLGGLDLSGNQLTGAIPASFENLKKLMILILSRNQLSGTVPAFLGELPKLNTVRLNQNFLFGALPLEVIQRFHAGSPTFTQLLVQQNCLEIDPYQNYGAIQWQPQRPQEECIQRPGTRAQKARD